MIIRLLFVIMVVSPFYGKADIIYNLHLVGFSLSGSSVAFYERADESNEGDDVIIRNILSVYNTQTGGRITSDTIFTHDKEKSLYPQLEKYFGYTLQKNGIIRGNSGYLAYYVPMNSLTKFFPQVKDDVTYYIAPEWSYSRDLDAVTSWELFFKLKLIKQDTKLTHGELEGSIIKTFSLYAMPHYWENEREKDLLLYQSQEKDRIESTRSGIYSSRFVEDYKIGGVCFYNTTMLVIIYATVSGGEGKDIKGIVKFFNTKSLIEKMMPK